MPRALSQFLQRRLSSRCKGSPIDDWNLKCTRKIKDSYGTMSQPLVVYVPLRLPRIVVSLWMDSIHWDPPWKREQTKGYKISNLGWFRRIRFPSELLLAVFHTFCVCMWPTNQTHTRCRASSALCRLVRSLFISHGNWSDIFSSFLDTCSLFQPFSVLSQRAAAPCWTCST